VVLDDITDPATAADWWPVSHTGTGWVPATTRRRDSALSGAGRRVADVDVYEADEADAYLTERLTGTGKVHLLGNQTCDLAKALGWLPLALSHAAAYMIDQRVSCGACLALYTAGERRLTDLMPATADADGYGRQVAVILLLALDAADACHPVGLARPAMDLAAVLDPTGHPEAFWTTEDVTTYLTAYRSQCEPLDQQTVDEQELVTPRQARDAVLLLDPYGLATLNEQAGPRAVRVHALTARACAPTPPPSATTPATRSGPTTTARTPCCGEPASTCSTPACTPPPSPTGNTPPRPHCGCSARGTRPP
jgi:hypothetical protein